MPILNASLHEPLSHSLIANLVENVNDLPHSAGSNVPRSAFMLNPVYINPSYQIIISIVPSFIV